MSARILLVDDEAPARARLRTLLDDLAGEDARARGWQVAGEEADGHAALAAIARERPDLVLLDMQMPGMDGIACARAIDDMEDGPAVIFVTAYDDRALAAFEVHAFDYLVKPVRAERLAAAIARVLALRGNGAATAPQAGARLHFTVHERDKLALVPVEDVLYLKASLKYVSLYTREREYLIEESLSSIEEEMGARFVRVHRNALVARDAIAAVEKAADEEGGEGWQVVLRGVAERLPISRRQWAAVKALVR